VVVAVPVLYFSARVVVKPGCVSRAVGLRSDIVVKSYLDVL
jgi:hypothetical protein